MWKDAVYNGKIIENYEINKKAVLRNKITKKIVKSHDNVKGKDLHQRVSIKHKQYYLHKIVAETFIPNPKPGIYRVIRHKDDNPLNNAISNLEWGTHQDNTLDAIKNGKIVYDEHRKYTRNEDHPGAILTNKQVENICKQLQLAVPITDIAKDYKVDRDVILHIYKGNTWKPISKKYFPFPEQHVYTFLPLETKEKILEYMKHHENATAMIICNELNLPFDKYTRNFIGYQRKKVKKKI